MIFGPPRLQEGDDLIACPCGSTLPALRRPRFNPVRRGNKTLSIETAMDYLCPDCGDWYTLEPKQRFAVRLKLPKPQVEPKPEYKQPADTRPLIPRERP